MKRTTEITIETERVVVVAAPRPTGGCERWCEGCGAQARVIALEDAARILRVEAASVHRWAAEAGFHVIESGDSLFVCLSFPRIRQKAVTSDR